MNKILSIALLILSVLLVFAGTDAKADIIYDSGTVLTTGSEYTVTVVSTEDSSFIERCGQGIFFIIFIVFVFSGLWVYLVPLVFIGVIIWAVVSWIFTGGK